MAHLTIGGRSFEIAPYKIGALRKAAPHIDAVNSIAGALTTIEGMMAAASHTTAILAIGLQKLDPELTQEALEDMIGIEDMPTLAAALQTLMAESGFAKKEAPAGEAVAPSEQPEAEGALSSSSSPSSLN